MITQVLVSGFGGQGVVLAGVVLGHAAVLDGLHAAQAASYGAESQGTACKCGVVISDQPIAYPHVTEVDWLLAMSQDGYNRYHAMLLPSGNIILDDGLVNSDAGDAHRHIRIGATKAALEHFNHRMVANMIFLGAAVRIGNFVSRKSLEEALRLNVPPQHLEANLRAIDLGYHIATVG
jgi:2-oxoglutarate ferredoxin oxidoreductase subunit gamma